MKKHNGMSRAEWIQAAGNFCAWGTTYADVARLADKVIATRSSLIHASHLLALERTDWPVCPFCNGPTYDMRASQHELCRLRDKRGVECPPIPPPTCACTPCQRGGR